MRIEAPYHEGELEVQARAGEAGIGLRNGRAVSDSIIPGAIKFVALQPMAVLGSLDDGGNVWASLVLGRPGFMTAGPRTLDLDLAQTLRQPGDPLWSNLDERDGRDRRDQRDQRDQRPRVGAIVIDLASRKRLRVNGRAAMDSPDRLRLEVDEAYPNCPKYIQRRHLEPGWAIAGETPPEPRRGRSLEPAQQAWVSSADTLFVASAHPEHGADASHRGGAPGFVRVLDERTLRIPDYPGNSMFNTLGNFVANPNAGLLFIDFERGRTLQLVGRPEIRWDLEDPGVETGGTRRSWDMHVAGWIETRLARPPRWELLDASPHNP